MDGLPHRPVGGPDMELKLSPQDEAFREEMRAFMRDNLPPDIQHKVRMGLKLA